MLNCFCRMVNVELTTKVIPTSRFNHLVLVEEFLHINWHCVFRTNVADTTPFDFLTQIIFYQDNFYPGIVCCTYTLLDMMSCHFMYWQKQQQQKPTNWRNGSMTNIYIYIQNCSWINQRWTFAGLIYNTL